jgi:hypothetical protein
MNIDFQTLKPIGAYIILEYNDSEVYMSEEKETGKKTFQVDRKVLVHGRQEHQSW